MRPILQSPTVSGVVLSESAGYKLQAPRRRAGALTSRRKIMISLSPPIKPAAHARYPVGTRSPEKLDAVVTSTPPPVLSFVCRPEIFPLRIFHVAHIENARDPALDRFSSTYFRCDARARVRAYVCVYVYVCVPL